MKRIKKFLVSLCLTKQQKIALWNSLCYSNHVYRRRGDVDNAACTKSIMEQVQYILGASGAKYNGEEVHQMIEDAVSKVSEEITKKAEKDQKKIYELAIVEGQKLAFKRLEEEGIIEVVHNSDGNIVFVPKVPAETEEDSQEKETTEDSSETKEQKEETKENSQEKEETEN